MPVSESARELLSSVRYPGNAGLLTSDQAFSPHSRRGINARRMESPTMLVMSIPAPEPITPNQ
jgi:hypothetical protein